MNEINLFLGILYTTPETLILVNYWVLELEFQGKVSPQGNYSFLVEVGKSYYAKVVSVVIGSCGVIGLGGYLYLLSLQPTST